MKIEGHDITVSRLEDAWARIVRIAEVAEADFGIRVELTGRPLVAIAGPQVHAKLITQIGST